MLHEVLFTETLSSCLFKVMKQTLSFSKIRFTHNFKVLSRLLTLIISKRFTCVSLLGGTPEKRLMGEIYESTNTFNHPVLTAKIRAVFNNYANDKKGNVKRFDS